MFHFKKMDIFSYKIPKHFTPFYYYFFPKNVAIPSYVEIVKDFEPIKEERKTKMDYLPIEYSRELSHNYWPEENNYTSFFLAFIGIGFGIGFGLGFLENSRKQG